jgi:hypothetical protein
MMGQARLPEQHHAQHREGLHRESQEPEGEPGRNERRAGIHVPCESVRCLHADRPNDFQQAGNQQEGPSHGWSRKRGHTLAGVRAGGLTQTLHRQLRAAIIERRLPGGFALPSTRRLADHLGVGRNTVIEAYDLLVAQGHALTHIGYGCVEVIRSPAPWARFRRNLPVTPRAETGIPGSGVLASFCYIDAITTGTK